MDTSRRDVGAETNEICEIVRYFIGPRLRVLRNYRIYPLSLRLFLLTFAGLELRNEFSLTIQHSTIRLSTGIRLVLPGEAIILPVVPVGSVICLPWWIKTARNASINAFLWCRCRRFALPEITGILVQRLIAGIPRPINSINNGST